MINEELKQRALDSYLDSRDITFYDSNNDTVVVDHKDSGEVEYFDVFYTENFNKLKSKKVIK